METNLLDRMLNTYQTSQTPVTVTLQNKIRVSGVIKAFDSYVVIIEGQKREIVYRHAMSSLAPTAPEESKKSPALFRTPEKSVPRAAKPAGQKLKNFEAQQQLSASWSESSINTGMKEGLLKWMQENKAAK